MMKKKSVVVIFGTRPEVIKLAPLISLFKELPQIELDLCFTGQHPDMVKPLLDFFKIIPNINLSFKRTSSSLSFLTEKLISNLETLYDYKNYDLTVVQGDTTSSFVGSLVSFYHKVPVAHVEAGLRSGDKYSPFPEEMNRVLIGRLADLHFAPTKESAANLRKEGITENVWVTGNTVIDALFLTLDLLSKDNNFKERILNKLSFLRETYDEKKLILITVHRRENWGRPLKRILLAIKQLSRRHKDILIVFPMHKNPELRKHIKEVLSDLENVTLTEPLSYPELVLTLERSYLVLTDSGGIQEEAPALGKPVLVLRNTTERIEGVKEGVSIIVGTETANIVNQVEELLKNKELYDSIAAKKNPYGDGQASKRILKEILTFLGI